MIPRRLLVCALLCLVCCPVSAQLPLKAGMSPGSYLLGSDVLTVNSDGTITLAKAPLTLAPLGTTPGPGPAPTPAPTLNARAQAVLTAVQGITDPDRAKDAAGFAEVLRQTKAMIVANKVGDASIIGMTLQFAISKTVNGMPAGVQAAWKTVADLIGTQFNDQQRQNADAVLTVFDDAISGLAAAAPGVTVELPFQVDPLTGKAKLDGDGKEIANPKYVAGTIAAGTFDWLALIKELLPLILQILQMFMS